MIGIVQPTTVPVGKAGAWPLNPKGILPRELFPTSYLYAAFFQTALKSWTLDAGTMRRGLKHFIKRFDVRALESLPGGPPLQERDELLIALICDNEKLRQKFTSIEFHVRNRKRPLSPPALPTSLWRFGYRLSGDPELVALSEWFLDASTGKPGKPDARVVKADAFAAAVAAAPPPCPLGDLVIARAVVLFAALLEAEERDELLRTAKRLGVSIPESCDPDAGHDAPPLSPEMPSSEPPESVAPAPAEVRTDAPLTLPRLETGGVEPVAPPEPEGELATLRDRLGEMETACAAAAEVARDQFNAGLETLVSGGSAEFERAVESLKAWRDGQDALGRAQTALDERVETVRAAIEDKIGLPVAPPKLHPTSAAVGIAAEAAWASTYYEPEFEDVQRWRTALPSPVPMSRLPELATLHAQRNAHAHAEARFQNALVERLPNGSVDAVRAWLPDLGAEELVQVATRAAALGGPVLCALVTAYGVERHDAAFAERAAQTLFPVLPTEARRSALRFIQRSSARLDGAPEFRRYVCREHFANLLFEGPLAQIADVSVGTADAAVVGRPLTLAVEAIVANLDIVASRADIQRRLAMARKAGENTAAKAAVEFIRTPAGMSGHFRRLREHARDAYFEPLLSGDGLNIRQTRDLLKGLADGQVEQAVFDDVQRGLPSNDRLESQHRLQLTRYLQSAAKQLEAAVRAESSKVDRRTVEFADRLEEAIEAMSAEGPSGSIGWLEAQFIELLRGDDAAAPVGLSLIGDEEPLSARLWSATDDAWRDRAFPCVEFYRSSRPTLWSVLCALTAHGGEDPVRIVETLLDGHDFGGALRAAIEAAHASAAHRPLRKRVEETASPLLRETRARLEDLERHHGRDTVRATDAFEPLKEALSGLNVTDAESYVALLGDELETRKEQTHRDRAAAQERLAAAELRARLLRAGDQGASDRDLDTLRTRWEAVLDASGGRRAHLVAIERIVKPIGTATPEFAPLLPLIADLQARSEDPDWWLPEDVARELIDYLSGTIQHLTRWTAVVGVMTSDVRRDLSALLSAFLSFLYDRTDGLRSASTRADIDGVLESVIEFELAVTSGANPLDCLQALAEAGLIRESETAPLQNRQVGTEVIHGRRQAEDLAKSMANAVDAKAWQELLQLARNARPGLGEDEVPRIDDIADYAQVMERLSQDDRRRSYDMLDGAARAISTSGQPVHRALSARERNATVLRLLQCALHPDNSASDRPDPKTWSELLAAHPALFRVDETSPTQLSRVLSIVFGGQAYELADLAWTGATSLPELSGIRADLLIYLHDQGQADTIVRLCARHDPIVKSKLEQMLELRNASIGRPALVAVADALGGQVAAVSKSAAVRQFIRRLPRAVQGSQGSLKVELQDALVLRSGPYSRRAIRVSVTAVPDGIVPSQLQVQVVADDDVTFSGRSGRIMTISDDLLYAPKDFVIPLTLGETWDERIRAGKGSNFRLRFSAKTVTENIVTTDLEVPVISALADPAGRTIDNESLLEFYPGVSNTPAVGDAFVGRAESLEQLHNFLVAARQPSPVLLTGMRRVGKTSLLQEFHRLHRKPGNSQALTVYLSLAELRQQFLSEDSTVSATLYRAIGRALSKREFSATDYNRELGERLKQNAAADWGSMRALVQETWDGDSMADSLMLLGDRVLDVARTSESRLILLLDEAEALTYPYNKGGAKKIELEQLLQSLREVSQASDRVAMVLSGSNHITAFAKEYKNAFFGSCVDIELEGLTSVEDASKLIAPARVAPFVQFEPTAIEYGINLCAGMPQFMWQLGAATVHAVRGGVALRSDVRSAVSALVDGDHTKLPFKSYDVLEPIEHMLSLQGDRERDLLWLLLRRVAQTSSLSALHAPWHFLIESQLLELDNKPSWNRRLQTLVELKILTAEANNSYRFKVPLFAEGFRAARADYDAEVRLRRLGT